MQSNIISLTDSYKASHYRQYPPGTTHVFSYLESRGGEFDKTVFFGLQYVLMEYLAGVRLTHDDIDAAKIKFYAHFGQDLFNEEGWRRIVNVHGGRLPVEIRAVPEGTVVPVSNALLTIVNTDENLPWLTNYLETILCQVWYPTTVATQSYYMKRIILEFLEKTGSPELIDFKLHDFGFRGSTSVESSAIGGAAHMVNFQGTDTLSAVDLLMQYYVAVMPGFSIPAAEHSTITSWGKEHEVDAYENMLKQFPTGLVAVVSDSYDIFTACRDMWGKQLRSQVLERDGVLVIRPDSGYPPDIVCSVVKILCEQFGSSVNAKGYRVLNPKVRVIQGDGIDLNMIMDVLAKMKEEGLSADNVAFGSGGGLLQKVNRDTLKFAFKCSAIRVNGEWQDVYKSPVTDTVKFSKRGRLKLVHDVHGWRTVQIDQDPWCKNKLETVFRDGSIIDPITLDTVRDNAIKG